MARIEIRSLPPATKRQVRTALDTLARDGLEAAVDLRRLSTDAGTPVYRVRVGTWRIVFMLDGDAAQVLRVFPRREGYAWMERAP